MSKVPFSTEEEARFVVLESADTADAAAWAAADAVVTTAYIAADAVVAANFATADTALAARATLLEAGVFDGALAGNSESSTGTSGALSIVKLQSLIDSTAGAGSRTLAAPTASTTCRLKIIRMSVDNGDTTLATTNMVGQGAGTAFTFAAVGDQIVLLASGNKWLFLGGNITAA